MIPFWKKTDKSGKKKPPKPAVPRTAQQSIPMQRMFEDGTCRVKANYYNLTITQDDSFAFLFIPLCNTSIVILQKISNFGTHALDILTNWRYLNIKLGDIL